MYDWEADLMEAINHFEGNVKTIIGNVRKDSSSQHTALSECIIDTVCDVSKER